MAHLTDMRPNEEFYALGRTEAHERVTTPDQLLKGR